MTMRDELNRLGYEVTQRRLRAAEGFARQALDATPFANETASEFARRLRGVAERTYPELILRFEHSRQEIFRIAENCGCDPNADDYDDDHCESDEGGEYLCGRQHLGSVCDACEDEDGDGPSWRPDRYEWPCPAVSKLDLANGDTR
ncbi:hypothetical protein ACFT43_06395 [Streptomyces albidoflavus]